MNDTSTGDCVPAHEEILTAINDRKTWEDRQTTWYQMRHDGLRRRRVPFPGAADLHYPLADTLIEKQKPGYIDQIFATDTVATFTALKQDWQKFSTGAAQWFDYQLKQNSNFEREIVIGADRMMQSGKCVLKVFWDAEQERVRFEAINPLHVIVPAWTGQVREADWIVHVQHYSKHAYRRLNPTNDPQGFDTKKETIDKLLTGTGADANSQENAKVQREGITKGGRDAQIVVWELFYRDERGQIRVRTYSPQLPRTQLRPEFGLPYTKGPFSDKLPPFPFFELNCETKDRGYYDSRGICERVAPFEAKLCKEWNAYSDWMTLWITPMFYAKNGVPNNANLRMVPGQIVPFELQAVQTPGTPPDIPASMLATRQTAQELVGTIDYGTPAQAAPKDRKTATETNLIGNVMAQSTGLRARIFRRELGHGFELAYAILLQYAATSLDYFYQDELQQLPELALQGKYRIELSGSGENNRAATTQRALALLQQFRGDPYIEQGELRKMVLEANDPRMVKRLFLNAGTQAAAQMEDQAQEITAMLIGFPSEVKQTDDHLAHLGSLFGFLERRMMTRQPIGPEMIVLAAQHATQHAQAAQQTAPEAWKQQAQQVTPKLRQLQQLAQAAQQQLAIQQQQQQQAAQMAAMAGGNPAGDFAQLLAA
ncbi:MAG: hypothetical protein B9S38_02425 [Verrucomicrobiia bacterium Tous-C4TDCM]|nr:MAG: hypothetical protein B9S38_02425 [Verrucomicrobiae bacterium Tous-C4TDCM]